eukprot:4768541-Heterocapsa_arctica.AAC.1
MKELLVTSIDAETHADQQAAMKEAWAAGDEARLVIREATVRRRILTLRRGAQPGASRTRNDLLAAMLAAPDGLRTLTLWCQIWADGLVPPVVAQPFLAQVLRPLRKPNGMPRNIALLEVFFKLASGVTQDEIRVKQSQE